MSDPITIALVGGTALSVMGSLQAGEAAEKAGKFEAAQLEQQAKARRAQGTREAVEAKRAGDIMESKARAQMAAGGGVTTDPGAIEQLGGIGAEAEYASLAALYEGETEATGLRRKAQARRYEGKMAKRTGHVKALSTALMGGASAYRSYTAPSTNVTTGARPPGGYRTEWT